MKRISPVVCECRGLDCSEAKYFNQKHQELNINWKGGPAWMWLDCPNEHVGEDKSRAFHIGSRLLGVVQARQGGRAN